MKNFIWQSRKKDFLCFNFVFFKTYILIHFRSVFQFLILWKHQKTYDFLLFSGVCNFIKKQTQVQMFFCEFCENFESNVLTEYLQTTASVINISIVQIQGCINNMILSNTQLAFTCSQLTAETPEQCVKSVFKVRSSHPEVFYKKGVLRNFTNFTGKHLCQCPFFDKVTDLSLQLY